MEQPLRIATRNSPLALWQANHVGELIKSFWPTVQIKLIPMLTSGDRFLKNKLQTIGGKGLFVKELEEALLDNRADLAVHSMKDVPTQLPNGLVLIAICKRDNPLDAFVSQHYSNLTTLPQGSIIGTNSLRRQSQLLALRPDVIIQPLRGNITTRLNKLKQGHYTAIILAVAGLTRLGMMEHIKEIIHEDIMLPSCGQGALGIECRADNNELHQLLIPLNDPVSAICVNAERHVNALLGGNCHVPLGVYCRLNSNNQLLLRAKLLTTDANTIINNHQMGSLTDATQLANTCANTMLMNGARTLLNCVNHES